MLRYERLNAVLDVVARQGRVSVDEIVDAFALSPATVRRDLDELASQQLITRTRGGAVAHQLTYDLAAALQACSPDRPKSGASRRRPRQRLSRAW